MAVAGIDRFISAAESANKRTFNTFQSLAVLAGVAVAPALQGECFQVRKSSPQHPDSVEIHGALRLDKVPYKRTETGNGETPESINILMDSAEYFKFQGSPSPETAFLYNAHVRIGYYKRRTKAWKTLLCIRYDFEGARNAHPIFHAQLENGILSGPTAAIFHDVGNIEMMKDLHYGIRFPSANMIGATALLKIAADHFPGESFRALLKTIQEQKFYQNWRCDCRTLDDPDSVKGMLSSGWYGSKHNKTSNAAAI